MPTAEEWAREPAARRVERLALTPGEVAAALAGREAAALARRPDSVNWSPTEIVCHLRDVEELFQVRFHTILALDAPTILVVGASPDDLARWRIAATASHPLDQERWAEDRQYRRQDPHLALAAFRRRRGDTVALLRGLSAAEWERVGIHPSRGRLTLGDWVTSLTGHDDNHVAQLARALEGRV